MLDTCGPNSAQTWQTRSNLVRFGLAQITFAVLGATCWPIWAKVGQRPTFDQCSSIWTKFQSFRANPDKVRPSFPSLGQVWAAFGQHRNTIWCKSAKIRPTRPMLSEFGPSLGSCGNFSTTVDQALATLCRGSRSSAHIRTTPAILGQTWSM